MAINITPEPVAFGGLLIDRESTMSVTVTGTSEHANAEVALTIESSSGPGTFSVTPASGRATRVGQAFQVTFRPTGVGDVTATLKVTGTNPAFSRVAHLTGKGIQLDNYEKRGGSHLLISVPDYGETEYVNMTAIDADDAVDPTNLDGGATLNSYLRLGVFDWERESPAAKELLAIIPKAGAARDPRSPDPETPIIPAVPAINGTIFVDDVRVRPQDVNDNYKLQHDAKVDALSKAEGDKVPANTQTSSLGPADDPDHGLTMTQRQQESAKLYSRGGWRDHSDGNRISTTWGDKVEVIRGNYKMIVLGRQNDPAKSMGWEATGGHIQDHAPGTMPGASFWLEWIDDARFYAPTEEKGGDGRKGAWLLVNTTENVYQFARTAGNLRTENWGDVHETYIGSSNPPAGSAGTHETAATGTMYSTSRATPAGRKKEYDDAGKEVETGHPGDEGTRGHTVDEDIKIKGYKYLVTTPPDENDQVGKIRNNPHIIGKTWAVRIDNHTGSSDWAIPKIVEKKFVDDSWACTGSSGTRVKSAYEETFAVKVEELVDVEERIISNTRAGNIVEATTAGTITGATTAANIFEGTTALIHTETHVGGVHLELELGVFHGELEIALKGAIQIAGGYEVSIGSVAEFELDRKKMRLVNKQVALDNTSVSLRQMLTNLDKQDMSLENKMSSLHIGLTALAVQLGM